MNWRVSKQPGPQEFSINSYIAKELAALVTFEMNVHLVNGMNWNIGEVNVGIK